MSIFGITGTKPTTGTRIVMTMIGVAAKSTTGAGA